MSSSAPDFIEPCDSVVGTNHTMGFTISHEYCINTRTETAAFGLVLTGKHILRTYGVVLCLAMDLGSTIQLSIECEFWKQWKRTDQSCQCCGRTHWRYSGGAIEQDFWLGPLVVIRWILMVQRYIYRDLSFRICPQHGCHLQSPYIGSKSKLAWVKTRIVSEIDCQNQICNISWGSKDINWREIL